MSLAVVIPTLNEGARLPGLLADLARLADETPLRVVVADGGSSDGTAACARSGGATLLSAPQGRARQLNAGARATHSRWLLFLHADCRLPADARIALTRALSGDGALEAAVFRFAIDLPPFWKRFIETGQALRDRLLDLPYGDQGLLVRRDLFETVGGYPEVPIMEDVAMVEALRRHTRIARLPARLETSGRRYVARGHVRTLLRHWVLISLYLAGVPPTHLAGWRR